MPRNVRTRTRLDAQIARDEQQRQLSLPTTVAAAAKYPLFQQGRLFLSNYDVLNDEALPAFSPQRYLRSEAVR